MRIDPDGPSSSLFLPDKVSASRPGERCCGHDRVVRTPVWFQVHLHSTRWHFLGTLAPLTGILPGTQLLAMFGILTFDCGVLAFQCEPSLAMALDCMSMLSFRRLRTWKTPLQTVLTNYGIFTTWLRLLAGDTKLGSKSTTVPRVVPQENDEQIFSSPSQDKKTSPTSSADRSAPETPKSAVKYSKH